MSRLKGKNVLITGASSGIGQAIAVRFAREGANVAINYRSGAEQAETTRQMARDARCNCNGPSGGKEKVVQADGSDQHQGKDTLAKEIQEFRSHDGLVKQASILKTASGTGRP